MKIGVFDSGIGGEAVARDFRVGLPDASILTVSDQANLPYGSKTPQHIKQLVDNAIQPLLHAECDVIVIACNTATTIALTELRERYPGQKFIGIEPMVRTASSLTKTGVVCICATPATLASQRYRDLKNMYGQDITFVEPDCGDWAQMIENDTVNEQVISTRINQSIDTGADVIVLGCTHYHWVLELIEQIAADRAVILEPTDAIVSRIKQLIGEQPR